MVEKLAKSFEDKIFELKKVIDHQWHRGEMMLDIFVSVWS